MTRSYRFAVWFHLPLKPDSFVPEFEYLVFLLRRLAAHDLIRHGFVLLLDFQERHALMVLPQIEECRPSKDHNASRKELGYRKTDSREQQLVCPQAFDPDSAKPISEDIQKEQFPFVFLVFPVQRKDHRDS